MGQNGNDKVNNGIQRGIRKWNCSCYANSGVHRRILHLRDGGKQEGRVLLALAGAYLLCQEGPLSNEASSHGALHADLKGSTQKFDQRVALLFMKYGCFIFHLLLPGWFTNLLYNSSERRKTKQTPLSCIIFPYWQYCRFAETNDPMQGA